MAVSPQPFALPQALTYPAVHRLPAAARYKAWLPSLADWFFMAVLVWLFAVGSGGWTGLLADADAGWHIRTGEYILDHRSVPEADLFSFSKPGQPWYAWEWLSDVGMAVLHRQWGLKGIVFAAGVLIAAAATVVLRHQFWRGTNVFVALLIALLATGASSVHFLARPHITTMFLVAVSMWVIDRDRRAPSAAVWWLVPLAALWTNLHGGFLALLACLALLAVGTFLEAMLWRDPVRWCQAGRYTGLAALCAAATLANPYGVKLHVHIAQYLRSDWIREMVQEFQSPTFRNENLLQFEVLLFLGVMAVGFLAARKHVVETLWILFWAHQALGSARHVPIFAIVAAPILSSEWSRLWDAWCHAAPRRSVRRILNQLSEDAGAGFRRTSFWAPALAVLVVAFNPAARWPQDFPVQRFPVKMAGQFAERLSRARVFTSDQWADYLIYRFYPRQRVFFDGRSDFYGPAVGNQYLALSQGRYDWAAILGRNGFDMVLSPVDWPLASLLKAHPGWKVMADDGKAVLFERLERGGRAAAQTAENPPGGGLQVRCTGLMKTIGSAERQTEIRRQHDNCPAHCA